MAGMSPATSARAKHERQMDFPLAMQAVIGGKTITKKAWENDDRCQMRDGWLMIRRNGTWHQWLVNDGDLMGTDWMVVADES